MAKNGKRMQAALDTVDRETRYELPVAVKLVKNGAATKFDETVEIVVVPQPREHIRDGGALLTLWCQPPSRNIASPDARASR